MTLPSRALPRRPQAKFEAAIRAYWPGLPAGALQPGYAGVRPKARALCWRRQGPALFFCMPAARVARPARRPH